MARKAGPVGGAEAGPDGAEERAQDIVQTGSLPVPASLEPGEPSWPEDPAALRTDALASAAQEETQSLGSDATDARPGDEASNSGAIPLADLPRADEGPWPPHDDREASRAAETPAGWDWEAEATGPDEAPEDTDADRTLRRPALEDEASPVSGLAGAAGVRAATSFPPESRPVDLPPRRRSGFGALLLGGVVAAALGFGAAWFAQDRFGGAALPTDLDQRLAALEARPQADSQVADALAGRVDDLEARLAALESAPPPASAASFDPEPLRQEFAAGIADAQARTAALDERLAALEARAPSTASNADPGPAIRPAASADAGAVLEPRLAAAESALSEAGTSLVGLDERVGANETAVSELTTRLDEVETRLDAVESTGAAAVEEARAAAAALEETRSRAEAAEAQARREAAIAALDSALDSGQPFEAALPALGADIPEPLTRAAAEGVPSLATLRESFPEAARAGLAVARRDGLVEDGGILGFLSGQLSVRSTAPREGTDPDAILSRAEGALAQGRLSDALAEIDALPETVRAAMADWIAPARARAEAEAALAALRDADPIAAPAE